ncbi:MAG: hypothetical protein H0T62_14550 [Parachlamydiaceae bacterium]|nr:hypothetical protein [Parachlamydiaceae bacterium]
MFYKMLGAILITTPLVAALQTSAATTQQNHHITVKAEELKSWYNTKKQWLF